MGTVHKKIIEHFANIRNIATMKLFPLLFLAVTAQEERIECYKCEYRISDSGDESGVECLNIDEKTPKKSYLLMKTHTHHGPGVTTKSRTDCVTVQGQGTEWVTGKTGQLEEYTYKYLSRHEWDNYEDSTTFEYSGELGLEYRERTQDCGANKPECAMGQRYPISPRVRDSQTVTSTRTIRAEPHQNCPKCEHMEYQSTRNGNPTWVTSSGDQNCVSNPTTVEGSARDCFGKCLVDQEEFMHDGQDYKRATYRWCSNGTSSDSSTRKYPDSYLDAYIQTTDMRLCQGTLCNDHIYNGSAAQLAISSALFLILTFLL